MSVPQKPGSQKVIVIDDDEGDQEKQKRPKLVQPLYVIPLVAKGKRPALCRNPVRQKKKKNVRPVVRQLALKPKPPPPTPPPLPPPPQPPPQSRTNFVNNDLRVTPSVNQSILKSVLLNESMNYQTLPVLLNTVPQTQPTTNNLGPTTLIFNNQPMYESQEMHQMMSPKNFLVQNEGTGLLQNTMKTENNIIFMTSNQNSGGILTSMGSPLISVKEENGKQNCMLPISPKNVVLRSYLMNSDVNYQNLSCGQTLTTGENMMNSGFPMLNTVMTSQPLMLNNNTVNCGIQSNISQPSQIMVVGNIQPVTGNMQLLSQPQTSSNVPVLQNPNYVSSVQSNYQILTQPQTVNIINLSQVPNTNEIITQNLSSSMGQLNTMQTPTIIYTQPQCSNNTPSQNNIINLHSLQPQINPVPSSQMQQIYVQNTNNPMQQQSPSRFRILKPNIMGDNAMMQQNVAVNNPLSIQTTDQKIVETSKSIRFRQLGQRGAPISKRGRGRGRSSRPQNPNKVVKTRGRRKGDIDWNEISSSNILTGKRPRRKVRELKVIEFSDSDEEMEQEKEVKLENKGEEVELNEEILDVKLEVKEEIQEEDLEWESMVIIENDIECS